MELRNTVDTPLGRERLDFVDVAKGMMILAVVFMRDKSSERYRELYMEQDQDWEKKD